MKAKLISNDTKSELILNDGRVFKSKKSETPDDLFARVANLIDEESGEPIQISSELTFDKLKKRATKDLEKKLEDNPSTLEVEIATEILVERGELEPKKAKKVKTAAVSIDDEAARKNIGKNITFKPWDSDEMMKGVIKSVVHDKRVGKSQYRIECEDGKIRGKRTESADLAIED